MKHAVINYPRLRHRPTPLRGSYGSNSVLIRFSCRCAVRPEADVPLNLRSVPGAKLAGAWKGTLLHGFNQAYNARRQRVLKGRSPERVVRERLGAAPARANLNHDPPFDPCSLPKALQVISRAKDVSHPDTHPSGADAMQICECRSSPAARPRRCAIRA